MRRYAASKEDVGEDELTVALCKEYYEFYFVGAVSKKINHVSVIVDDASKQVTRLGKPKTHFN